MSIKNPETHDRIIEDERLNMRGPADYLFQEYSKVRPIDSSSLGRIFQRFLEADGKLRPILLEPGCGPGRVLKVLAESADIKLVGIDKRTDLVELAKIATEGHKVELICADFLEYDFGKRRFDYILFSHYLHLQKDALSHLKKAHQLLNPGGRILIVFEDCAYYALLLGYPPATPEDHPFTRLSQRLKNDSALCRHFHSHGPYLPSEIRKTCEDSGMGPTLRLFPVEDNVGIEKVVSWDGECKHKLASVFHTLTESEIDKCIELGRNVGNDSSYIFDIKTYLFYTGNKVESDGGAKRSLSEPSCRDRNTGKHLGYHEFYRYLQNGIGRIFSTLPAVFLSVWGIHDKAQHDDRDVFYGGQIPSGELANWYYQYRLGSAKLPKEMSPSYLVGISNPSGSPKRLKLEPSLLREDLKSLYRDHNQKFTDDQLNEYLAHLLLAINRLNVLTGMVGIELKEFYFHPVRVDSGDNNACWVLLGTEFVDSQYINSAIALKQNCPLVDSSVAYKYHKDKLCWVDLHSKVHENSGHADEVKKMITDFRALLTNEWHEPQYAKKAVNLGLCVPGGIIEQAKKIRDVLGDHDLLHLENEIDLTVKIICLSKRADPRLLLCDLLGYAQGLGHKITISTSIDLTTSSYQWEFYPEGLQTVDVLLGLDEVRKIADSEVSVSHAVTASKGMLQYHYNMKVVQKNPVNEQAFRVYYGCWEKHQLTKVLIRICKPLFRKSIFLFGREPWTSGLKEGPQDRFDDLAEEGLFIVNVLEGHIIDVDGFKKWTIHT